ncbi:glycoside hydrolase family 16 protein [Cerasicoccus frondis]|uniref:glycoside hydrolase family 16 protein n=1 Tax=Cerasicoccus frondis TaxID=490090 RepID=UPI0028525700|nr:glycoside hydrolase family 16 protein [Cerasicoccus frondis]
MATWKQNKTQMAKSRCQTDGEGMMVQTVLPKLPGEGGSMQTKGEFGYGRWVARVKPSAVPGVLNSIFTKDWDDKSRPETNGQGGMSEVDIEFLTSKHHEDRAEVHLAIHLKGRNNFYAHYQEVDFNPSDDFHEWGFDILPDRVDWHVDGKIIHTWRYTEDAWVDENYEFFFNSWTMKNWIEGPPSETATYEIDWVKFYPLEKKEV